jgi:predicted ester cyclase
MSQENEAVVRRAFDEIAQGELAVADEIIAAEFVRHDLGGNFPDVTGPEGVKRLIVALRAAFPDIQTTLEDVISDGDRVVVRFTVRATHKGHFQGIAPTGRQVEWAGVNIYRVADGKIRETWQLADSLGLMRQLGAVPAAEGG